MHFPKFVNLTQFDILVRHRPAAKSCPTIRALSENACYANALESSATYNSQAKLRKYYCTCMLRLTGLRMKKSLHTNNPGTPGSNNKQKC